MDEDLIVTIYVVIDDVLRAAGHQSHSLARVTDAEVLTIAVVAAACFQNHHAVALAVMHKGYLGGRLSESRFNRRLHALADWLGYRLDLLGALCATGEVFILDRLPLPVCRRVRARRCRKVRGRAYCGDCPAKKEPFFGWRLHLVTTPAGVPVAFLLLPAACHDLTPGHEVTFSLPPDASILGDVGVRLVPIRKANMAPNLWADKLALREHRPRIETTTSQLAAMGIQRLHAVTNAGFVLKVHASLLALTLDNLH